MCGVVLTVVLCWQNNDNCYQLRSSVSPLPPSPPGPSSARPEVMEELNLKMLSKSQARDGARSQPGLSPSPVIVITGSEESPPKHRQLPFLNDIRQLRQAEAHQPSPGPGGQKGSQAAPGQDQHLGHIEARPRLNSFPFLDDIRKLRKDSAQTNKVEREDSRLDINHHNGPTESAQQRVLSMNIDGNTDKPTIPPKEKGGAKEKFQNDLLKFNKEPTQTCLSVSPPTKSVRFSTFGEHRQEHKEEHRQEHRDEHRQEHRDEHRVEDRAERRQEHDNCSKQVEASQLIDGGGKSTKCKKNNKQIQSIKIDEKTNISKLADQIIPQLNNMQKNFLGLLFFNELSQNIVDDIVAQQLLMMSGSKLSAVLSSSLEPEVCLILKHSER